MSDKAYLKACDEFVALCQAFSPPLFSGRISTREATREFERVVGSGRFAQVSVFQGTLLAKTRMVYMKSAVKRWHRIGEFMLEITRNEFRAYNLTLCVADHHGPHIRSDGTICMSEGRELMMALIKNGQLGQALFMLERIVWHTNLSHHGQFNGAHVDQWPLAHEGEIQWQTESTAP